MDIYSAPTVCQARCGVTETRRLPREGLAPGGEAIAPQVGRRKFVLTKGPCAAGEDAVCGRVALGSVCSVALGSVCGVGLGFPGGAAFKHTSAG